MNFFTKVVFPGLLFCTLRVNPGCVSRCANEPKSLQTINYILRKLDHPSFSFPYGCYKRSSSTRRQCKMGQKKCSPVSKSLLQSLWYLLRDLENGRKCTSDEREWTRIKDSIVREAQGKRLTEKSQPDVFIIPDFLTRNQCEELVKIHVGISDSVNTK